MDSVLADIDVADPTASHPEDTVMADVPPHAVQKQEKRKKDKDGKKVKDGKSEKKRKRDSGVNEDLVEGKDALIEKKKKKSRKSE